MNTGTSNYSNIVKVNDVFFQSEIQSVVPIPIIPGTKIPIILGIRVTNNTSHHLYFNRLGSLEPLPNLIDSSGQPIGIDCDMWRARVKGKPYYAVAAGENKLFGFESFITRVFFMPSIAFSLFNIQLKIYNEAGGFYYFRNLKAEKYQLQLSYKGSDRLPDLSPDEQTSGKVWSGIVTLPFVEFSIT